MSVEQHPAPTLKDHVLGFYAAAYIVEKALDEACRNRPERRTLKMAKSAAYREGYWNGLLVAHCMHTLGEFPDVVDNAARIVEALAERDSKRA